MLLRETKDKRNPSFGSIQLFNPILLSKSSCRPQLMSNYKMYTTTALHLRAATSPPHPLVFRCTLQIISLTSLLPAFDIMSASVAAWKTYCRHVNELCKTLYRLPHRTCLTLYSFDDPEKVVAILKPSVSMYSPEAEAYELGQLADDGTFRQYSGSFPSLNCGRLMWVMHDSNHWYRVNLRLFVWNELIVGDLNVMLDPTRTVSSNVLDPCVSIIPPEYTQVIVK